MLKTLIAVLSGLTAVLPATASTGRGAQNEECSLYGSPGTVMKVAPVLLQASMRSQLTLTSRMPNPKRTAMWNEDAELPEEKGLFLSTANSVDAESTTTAVPGKDMVDWRSMRRVNDSKALWAAMIVNAVTALTCVGIFCLLRRRFPLVYANNVLEERVPFVPEDNLMGWAKVSCRLTVDKAKEYVGLDRAMYLEFTHLCLWLLLLASIPVMLVICPIYYSVGPEISDADIPPDVRPRALTLHWVQAGTVWYTVLVAEGLILAANARFRRRRLDWLFNMPKPWATTILVEGIPPEEQSDVKLRARFDFALQRPAVESAYVVRRSGDVAKLADAVQTAREKLHQNEDDVKLRAKLEEAAKALEDALKRFEGDIKSEDMTSCGFVTFHHRRDAMRAMHMPLAQLRVSRAPHPEDVRYCDILRDPQRETRRKVAGYSLVVLVWFSFTPILLGLLAVMDMDTLQQHVPFFKYVEKFYPTLRASWDGLVGSFLVNTLMGLVPSMFALVIRSCLGEKSNAWTQHRMQLWLFPFLLTFILLVVAVGDAFVDIWNAAAVVGGEIFKTGVFSKLASTLPHVSNFYLRFVTLELSVESMALTRYMNLLKFLWWRRKYGPERAREFAEPEDQDLEGMGNRCARSSLILACVLVFSVIEPRICILGLMYFGLARIYYGYLLVFAETHKPDLGGVFWYAQLRHLHQALFIYVSLMVGMLLQCSQSNRPAAVTGSCFVVLGFFSYRLQELEWETPQEDVHLDDTDMLRASGDLINSGGTALTSADSKQVRFASSNSVDMAGSRAICAEYKQPELASLYKS